VARGHRVRILCLRSNPAFEGPLEVERLAVPRWPRWWRELRFARAALERRRLGSADVTLAVRHLLEADLYQPHGGPFRTAIAASLEGVEPAALRLARLALRRLRPATRVLLWTDREILRRSPGLVVVSLSRKVEEDFRRAYPGLSLTFERIYNGVDLEEFHDRDREEAARALRQRLGIPPEARIALFVGHKFGPKGLREAVEAVAAAPGFHLVVLGGGRPAAYRRLARSAGVASRVHFAGAAREPRPFYAAADVLVHPTRYDPCSLAVLEALACGTPVITTTANGASELMVSGREGFVVEPGASPAIARALLAIGESWSRFHEAALARARDLGFERHLDAMEKVLRRAADERRKRQDPERAGQSSRGVSPSGKRGSRVQASSSGL